MTKTIDVGKPHESLSELVSLALSGTEVIFMEAEQPVARLVPVASRKQKRIAGLNRGSMSVNEDFDAPLPDEFWTGTS